MPVQTRLVGWDTTILLGSICSIQVSVFLQMVLALWSQTRLAGLDAVSMGSSNVAPPWGA